MMAFVSVPKDLTKVKNKIILNLTKKTAYLFWTCGSSGSTVLFFDQRSDRFQ